MNAWRVSRDREPSHATTVERLFGEVLDRLERAAYRSGWDAACRDISDPQEGPE